MIDPLVIAGVELRSRLFLGTGRYRTDSEMAAALEASGAELITVALRRLDLDDPTKKTLLDVIYHEHISTFSVGMTATGGSVTTARSRRWRRCHE